MTFFFICHFFGCLIHIEKVDIPKNSHLFEVFSATGSYTTPLEVFTKLRNFVDFWPFFMVISGKQWPVGV